jgi:hypothetical protein
VAHTLQILMKGSGTIQTAGCVEKKASKTSPSGVRFIRHMICQFVCGQKDRGLRLTLRGVQKFSKSLPLRGETDLGVQNVSDMHGQTVENWSECVQDLGS